MFHPYNSKEFKDLKAKWYKKLERFGFIDLEDEEGNLRRQQSARIELVYDVEATKEYFSALGEFVGSNPNIPKRHFKVLSMLSEGLTITQIAYKNKLSRPTIYKIIKSYPFTHLP